MEFDAEIMIDGSALEIYDKVPTARMITESDGSVLEYLSSPSPMQTYGLQGRILSGRVTQCRDHAFWPPPGGLKPSSPISLVSFPNTPAWSLSVIRQVELIDRKGIRDRRS